MQKCLHNIHCAQPCAGRPCSTNKELASAPGASATGKDSGKDAPGLVAKDPLFVGGIGALLGLAGLLLLKSQDEFLEGLVYGDTGLGDYAAAVLWAVGLYFCSPYQLLLLFLGKIETERPSDWILQKLGNLTGQRTEDVGYEAPLPLKAATVLFFIAAGTATAWLIHSGLGDATWSVSSGIGTCAAAGLYEVGRPDRLSGQEAETLEAQWQDFAAWANDHLQKSGQCHQSEIYSSFRKQFARYRSPDALSDAALKDMIRNWHPSANRTANGYYKNISVQAKICLQRPALALLCCGAASRPSPTSRSTFRRYSAVAHWQSNSDPFNSSQEFRKVQLDARDVHVWWLSVQEEASCSDAALLKGLAPEDQEYAASTTLPAERRVRLLSRALLRRTLAGYCNHTVASHELQFARAAQGKPLLTWPQPAQPLHFNLTHTTSLIGLAVSSRYVVGLDVERTDRRPRHGVIRLAQHKFASSEVADLAGLADNAQVEAFNQLWTLKEAYVKATGRGINAPPGLKGFSFRLQRAAPTSQPAVAPNQLLQTTQPTDMPCQPLGDIQNLLPSTDDDLDARPSSKWPDTGQVMNIVFQPPSKQELNSIFALMTPAADHVAALCLQPLPQQATSVQTPTRGIARNITTDQENVNPDDQGQSPCEHILLSSYQCALRDVQQGCPDRPLHLIGSTHMPSICQQAERQLVPCEGDE
ncbi:hypothetical protein WJX74_008115 [Apatococcus lobatus]|uniref:holo-[acyl-carrier-protein] synthase n=1 Tax=Apatococcus lobatus TaxID=904363 RepID=A0AAW1QX03_9CHLO